MKRQPKRSISLSARCAVTGASLRCGSSALLSRLRARWRPRTRPESFTATSSLKTSCFGVVLYEMVSGRPPFEGETSDEVVAAILEREPPPLAQYAREAPAELQRIVAKALGKKREDRYETMSDLALDLKALKEAMEIETKARRGRRRKASGARRITIAVIALMILVAAATAINRLTGKPTIPFQQVDIARLTNNHKIDISEISPDGKFIVYVDSEKGSASLRLRQVATDSIQEIVPPAKVNYSDLAISPDGRRPLHPFHFSTLRSASDLEDGNRRKQPRAIDQQWRGADVGYFPRWQMGLLYIEWYQKGSCRRRRACDAPDRVQSATTVSFT